MQNNSATPIPSSVNGAVALLGRLLFVLIFLRAALKHFMGSQHRHRPLTTVAVLPNGGGFPNRAGQKEHSV